MFQKAACQAVAQDMGTMLALRSRYAESLKVSADQRTYTSRLESCIWRLLPDKNMVRGGLGSRSF